MSDNAAPVILLTRPRPASERFGAACTHRFGGNVRVVVAPLMKIIAQGEVPDLSRIGGLIFTSEAGVHAFADLTGQRDLPAWCVGDRTAEAARVRGISACSAGGTADDLVRLIGTQTTAPGALLHVHGTHTRGDVTARLAQLGVPATGVALYDQAACPPDAAFNAAMAEVTPRIVPLFSPRSAMLFAAAAGDAVADTVTVAISPATKAALPTGWQATCHLAQDPTAQALLDAISPLIKRPPWVEGPGSLV